MPSFKDEKKKSKKNIWCTSFYYEDWTGARKHKTKRGFATQREANEWERKFLEYYSKTPDITFAALYEKYMEYCKNVKEHSITTIERKESTFITHILPYFEKKKTNDIGAIDICNWQAEIKMKGYERYPTIGFADTYLKSINAELSAIFNYAMKFYRLSQNPCLSAGYMGKSKANAMKIWTLDDYNRFISFENKSYGKIAFDLFFWTGIREGELLGLTPSKLSDHSLRIEDNFQQTASAGDIINLPKNRKIREVSLPDFLYDDLSNYINGLYGIQPEERIFFFTKSFLQKEIKRVAALAGMDPIRIHDLRHSHVSLLIEMGYNIFMIADRIGDTVKVTMETYAHLYPDKAKMIAQGLHNVNANGLTANKTSEDQLLSMLKEIQKNLPNYQDFTDDEIVVWNPITKTKEMITDNEFKDRLSGSEKENEAIHGMMKDGYYEFSFDCIYCFASKSMPVKYL